MLSMPTIVFTLPGCQKFETATRYFANSLYPERMPLGFVTFSASDEPVPLEHFTDREIFEAVTLSIWLRRGNTGRFTKKNLDGDKVTASEMGGFASKIGILPG